MKSSSIALLYVPGAASLPGGPNSCSADEKREKGGFLLSHLPVGLDCLLSTLLEWARTCCITLFLRSGGRGGPEGAIFVSVSATDDNSKQVSRDSSAQSPPKSVMHTIGSNAVEPRAESDCPVLLAVRDRTDHLPISRHPVESTIPGVCCCQQPPRKGNVMGCW